MGKRRNSFDFLKDTLYSIHLKPQRKTRIAQNVNLSNTTMQSILNFLMENDLVEHIGEGRTHIFLGLTKKGFDVLINLNRANETVEKYDKYERKR